MFDYSPVSAFAVQSLQSKKQLVNNWKIQRKDCTKAQVEPLQMLK